MEELTTANNPGTIVEQATPAPQTAETSTQSTESQGTGQTEAAQEQFFDAKSLPPELQDAYKNMQGAFTKKMQEASEWRKASETLTQLSTYQPFVNWYNRHRAGLDKEETPKETTLSRHPAPKETPQPEQEPSPEDMALIMGDPKRFSQYIREQALKASMPMIQEAQQKAEFITNLNKVESFAREHADFWDLDAKGLIEPLIEKYPGMELEDIYRLAKFPFLEDEAIKKAHNIVQTKKTAVTEKPGQVMPGSTKVKVKSREEAMMLAFKAAEAGQEPPDFEFVR